MLSESQLSSNADFGEWKDKESNSPNYHKHKLLSIWTSEVTLNHFQNISKIWRFYAFKFGTRTIKYTKDILKQRKILSKINN